MSTASRVYPGKTTIETFPLLLELQEKGIKRDVKWSATNLGPNFRFNFSEIEDSQVAETSIHNSTPEIKLGSFSKEGPFGTTNYTISMDKAGEIWMWLQEDMEQLSPIFLASNPRNLAEIVDRFTEHLEDIKKSTVESEWEADWRRFLDDCRKIDRKGGSSYWASLAVDYLDNV